MKWSKFILGFLVVLLISYTKPRSWEQWGVIDVSMILIFLIVRSSDLSRALLMTFLLSFGVDLMLQTAQVKGLAAMSQLLLVFVIIKLKDTVIPLYEDLFLLFFFALFYISNHLLTLLISSAFDLYYPPLSFSRLVFLALFHTTILAVAFFLTLKFSRSED